MFSTALLHPLWVDTVMLAHLDISSEVLLVQNQPVKFVFQRRDSLDYRSVLWRRKEVKKKLTEWSF